MGQYAAYWYNLESSYNARMPKQKPKEKKKPAKKSTLFGRIQQCIDEKIRPYIQMDGGEIELVELTKKGVLKVRLHGACHGCAAAGITLQYGVQNAIDEEFPDEDIQLELID